MALELQAFQLHQNL